jgi:hypothetical protein
MTAEIIVDDAMAKNEPPLPPALAQIGCVVFYNQTPSFNGVAALLEYGEEVKPGQFVGVWHGRRGHNVLTVVQVVNAFEINPNESPELAAAREVLGLGRGYGGEGVSTRIYRLAECRTVEEFEVTGAEELRTTATRAPVLLARSGDPVVALPDAIAIEAIGGLTNDADGIALGHTYGSENVPVILNPLLYQLHVGVFGNPGKGKSYLMGDLLEEAVAWQIPSLVLDINGELVAAARSLGGLVITLPDKKLFGLSLNLMTPQELVAVTPNVQGGTLYAELIELAHARLREEANGKPITFNDLRDKINDLGEQTKTAKASIGAAIARITALEHDPLMGGTFDFIDALRKHGIVLLDCRFLSLRQTQLIAAMGARELQRIGREMARKAEDGNEQAKSWFAMYFVDEAHAVVPDDDKVVSTQVHFELARMGRHVRTGLVLSSQSPQDLNKSVLKRLQTRFVFALEKDQLRAIESVLTDLDEGIVKQLPKLSRGTCAVSGTGDVVRHGFLLSVRERVTPVKGSTPPVFGMRKKAAPRRGNA